MAKVRAARDELQRAAFKSILSELPEDHPARAAYRAGADATRLMNLVDREDLLEKLNQAWLDWYHVALPDGRIPIAALNADRGEYLAYVRMVGRRCGDVKLEEYCWPDTTRSLANQYVQWPLLRVDKQ